MFNFLTGTKEMEVTRSKYNGEIRVVKDFVWGTYIKVGGLTQSGGILYSVWNSTLRELQKTKPQIKTCLIFGLGGGSVARIVSKKWPEAKITGVDIDSTIVELGKKYLGLNEVNIDIVIKDAYQFKMKQGSSRRNNKYDLILVDLYNGNKVPQKFEEDKFLRNVGKMLNKDGVVIFNRLKKSNQFEKKLEKIFKKVEYYYPQANVELICYN